MVCKYGELSGFTNFLIKIQGFSSNRCPTDYSLLWFIGAIIGLFMVIALLFKWSFLGIIDSIGVLFLGFTLFSCSSIFGAILIAISLLGIGFFAFIKWG
jgi:hypothetical protein